VEPVSFSPGEKVRLTAEESKGAQYTWFFGDGTQGRRRKVSHRFPDAEGTELDGGARGAGRFRVMLRVEDRAGRVDWAAQGVVVVGKWHEPAAATDGVTPGLTWRIFPGTWTELPNLDAEKAALSGESAGLGADSGGYTRFATAWDGFVEIPADGGYTFHLMDRDGARLVIDGVEVARTGPPFAQVCGSPGNAMRYDRGALGLRAGRHSFHLEALHAASQGAPRVLWEGPALPITDVPQAAFRHLRRDGMRVVGTRD
jgi:hypothetical protein